MTWRRFAQLLRLAGLIWVLGIAMGLIVSIPPAVHAHSFSPPAVPSAWGIFSANLRVLTGCFMGLITGSLASVMTLMLNGIYLGIQWQLFTAHAPGWRVLALLAPHGLLEVPGMLLAGGVGMMGASMMRSFFRTGIAGIRIYYRPAIYGIPLSITLILLGAIVESWNISRL